MLESVRAMLPILCDQNHHSNGEFSRCTKTEECPVIQSVALALFHPYIDSSVIASDLHPGLSTSLPVADCFPSHNVIPRPSWLLQKLVQQLYVTCIP